MLTRAELRRLPRLSSGLDLTVGEAPQWVRITLQPHQVPPVGDWDTWILKAGRGAGKTLAGADATIKHLRDRGRAARVGVMAPTQSDAIGTCAEGETGLITLFGNEFPRYNRGRGEAWHYLGGYVRFLGSEKPDRWNGPQWSMMWVDEAALCNPKSIDQADFGLRLGDHPRAIWTTTPKAARWMRLRQALPGVVVTRATTYDNPHLSGRVLDRLEGRYAGTTLGRQELLAEDIDIPEGAIWSVLSERREDFLRPFPDIEEAPRFIRSGTGADWGTTIQHLAAAMGGSVTKEGIVWIRAAWGSSTGSSQRLIKALREMKDGIGAKFCAYDRSQGALEDWIEDPRNDEYGEPIGAGLTAVKGDRKVEWRVGIINSLLEQGRIFFDSSSDEVVEAYETFCRYHRDDDGEIVEEDDDYADALCYLVAELMHPTLLLPLDLGGMALTEAEVHRYVPQAGVLPDPIERNREKRGSDGVSLADYGGRRSR